MRKKHLWPKARCAHNPRALTATSFHALFIVRRQPRVSLKRWGQSVREETTYSLMLGVSTASNPTCASMAPTPQQRMLSGRCSVSAKVPKVNDNPLNVFLANLSIVSNSERGASGAANTLANYVPATFKIRSVPAAERTIHAVE